MGQLAQGNHHQLGQPLLGPSRFSLQVCAPIPAAGPNPNGRFQRCTLPGAHAFCLCTKPWALCVCHLLSFMQLKACSCQGLAGGRAATCNGSSSMLALQQLRHDTALLPALQQQGHQTMA